MAPRVEPSAPPPEQVGSQDAELAALSSALGRLQRLMANRRTYALAAAIAGVTESQQEMHVLRATVSGGAAPLGAIARRARMDAGAVSRQIAALERTGLITRSAGPGNSVILDATDAGRNLSDNFEAVRTAHLHRALRAWSAADRRRFAELIDRFVDDTSSTPYSPSDRPA